MTTRVAVLLAAILIAWGLKRHYADARADDLRWILSPTASLVALMTHTEFVAEPGEGYLARQRRFLIEKSCAGVNFMIAAFSLLAFALRRRIASPLSGARLLATSLAASYAATVVVNAARIATAMWLAGHPVSGVTPELVHRLEGITVYFVGLLVLYDLAQRFDRSPAAARART